MQQRVSKQLSKTFLQKSANPMQAVIMRSRMTNIGYFNVGVPMRFASFNYKKL